MGKACWNPSTKKLHPFWDDAHVRRFIDSLAYNPEWHFTVPWVEIVPPLDPELKACLFNRDHVGAQYLNVYPIRMRDYLKSKKETPVCTGTIAPIDGSLEWAKAALLRGEKVRNKQWLSGCFDFLRWVDGKLEIWQQLDGGYQSLSVSCYDDSRGSALKSGWELYKEPPKEGTHAWAREMLDKGYRLTRATWGPGDWCEKHPTKAGYTQESRCEYEWDKYKVGDNWKLWVAPPEKKYTLSGAVAAAKAANKTRIVREGKRHSVQNIGTYSAWSAEDLVATDWIVL